MKIYSDASTSQLLALLVGEQEVASIYNGRLTPLFEEVQHPALCAARELVKRWIGEELNHAPVFQNPTLVRDYLRILFRGQEYESFVMLFLDVRHRLISGEELFRGSLSQASVYPREVVKRALALNAGAVIASHNHPSGDGEPSQADRALTRRLSDALALVDIRMLDHIVVGASSAISLADRGWM